MAKAVKAVGTAIMIVGAVVATGGMALAMGAGVGLLGSASLATSAVLSVGSFSVSAGALLSVGSLVSSIGGSLSQPKVSSAGGALGWVGDPNGPLHFAAGRIAVGGDLRHKAAYGPNDRMYFSAVTVVSDAGPIDAFESFTANDIPVTFDASGKANSSYYANVMWRRTQLGFQPEGSYLASPSGLQGGASLPNWGASHKLSGKAAFILTLSENSKQSAYKGQYPKPRTIIRGLRVYDWRRDSTYPGGSGPQRLNDPSTWGYNANPILWSVKWLLGLWEGPTGKGAPQVDYQVGGIGTRWENIDVAAFTEAANIADTHGWTCAAWPSTDDDKAQVLDAFLQAGGAYYIERAGKASCIHRAAPRVSVATITAADTAGPIELDTSASYLDRKNTGVATYLSEADGWKMTALPEVSSPQWVTEDGGRKRSVPVTYSYVDKAKQAAELMCLALAHTREGISGRIPLKSYMQGIVPGAAFTITEPEFVLNGLKGLCLEANYDAMTGVHTVTFVSETDAKYPYAFGQTPNPPPPPALTPVDPTHVSPPLPGDWTITPRPPAPGGGQLPGFDLGGIVSNETATAVIVEYGPTATGPWTQAYQGPPTVTNIPIDGLQPGATYYVAVRYQRDQNYSERYVYGPYTVPNLEPSHLNSEPVQDILDKLTDTATLADQNRQAVEALEEAYGPTANAAASAAAAAASEAAAAQAKADAVIAAASATDRAAEANTAKTAAETARGQAQTFRNEASSAATTATGAAATSTAAAGQSVTAKDQAQGFATAANTSAGNAAGSATAAGNSASAADTAKVAAEAARDVADSKATAAATSASSAAASSTAAGNSASAANTAKTAAETARGQAQTAATNAASSRDDAAGSAASASASATLAANSKDAAAGSASAAAGSASTATTKAGEAGVSAAAAQASQVNASTAAAAAQGAAIGAIPDLISTTMWSNNATTGEPSNRPNLTSAAVVGATYRPGIGNVAAAGPKGLIPWVDGKIVEVTAVISSPAVEARARVGLEFRDATYARPAGPSASPLNLIAAGAKTTISRRFGLGVAVAGGTQVAKGSTDWVGFYVQMNLNATGASEPGANQICSSLVIRDITAQVAAELSASASATSASSAAASEAAAGQSANAASGSAATAATRAGEASSFSTLAAGSASAAAGSAATASQASGTSVAARDAAIGARNDAQAAAATALTQSSNASASAASAQISANLAAQVGGGSMNANPTFAAWSGTAAVGPDQWTRYNSANGTIDKAAGRNGQPNSARTISSGTANFGLVQAPVASASGGEWLAVEASVTLVAGDLRGAGMTIQARSGETQIGSNLNLDFATVADVGERVNGAGIVGRTYTYRALIDARTGAGVDNYRIYMMTRFSTFGPQGAVTLDWHRAAIRPATPEEVATKIVLPSVEGQLAIVADVAASADGTAKAIQGVVMDVNGYVSGYGSVNDGVTSAFEVLAANFGIRDPGSGERTEYRSGNWDVYSPAENTRTRYGKAFGGTQKLVWWTGPLSVAEGSETKANAYVYVSQNTVGGLRFGGSDVVGGSGVLTATASSLIVQGGRNGAGGVSTSTTTVTAAGGNSGASIRWVKVSGDDLVANSPSSFTTSFYGTVGTGQSKSAVFMGVVTKAGQQAAVYVQADIADNGT